MLLGILVKTAGFAAAPAAGQQAAQFQVIGGNVQKRANAVLTLMGYSVVPDLAASSLSISNATTANPGVSMSQYGAGFTLSASFPLYLEGF